MPFEGLEEPPLFVPEFDGMVTTSRGNGVPIRAETDTPDLSLMSLEGLAKRPLLVPKFDGIVTTARGNDFTVGAKTLHHVSYRSVSRSSQLCYKRLVRGR